MLLFFENMIKLPAPFVKRRRRELLQVAENLFSGAGQAGSLVPAGSVRRGGKGRGGAAAFWKLAAFALPTAAGGIILVVTGLFI